MLRILLFTLLASPLFAQAYVDSLSYGSISNDTSYGFAGDASGNTYAAVHFDGTIDLQPGAGTHNVTGFFAGAVAKYDSTRTVTWSYLLEPVNPGDLVIPEMPTIDPSGNVYVVGRFTGSVDFDASAGSAIETALDTGGTPATFCAFVLKLNAAGAFQWVRMMPGNYSWAYRVAASASRVFVSGIYSGTMDLDPTGATNLASTAGFSAFVAMFDAAGVQQWAQGNSGSGIELATAGLIGSGGDVTYVSSYIIDITLGQGGPAYITTGNCDMMIIHYTAAGTLDWVREIGTAGANVVPAFMSPSTGGDMYVSGSLNGAGGADFDPGPGTTMLAPQAGPNGFIAKYTATGDLLWAGMLNGTGNSEAFACAADTNGVVAFGQFAGIVDLDPGTGTVSHDASTGSILGVRFDANGNHVWSVHFGASSGGNEVFGAASTGTGAVVVGGPYTGTADWDPGAGTVSNTPVGGEDGFMVWLDDAAAGTPPTPPALTITTTTIAAVTEGTAVNVTLAATGGSGSGYQWSLVSGALPPGVTGLPGAGTPSINLTGAVLVPGTYNFRVRVNDNASNFHERDLAWTITVVGGVPPSNNGGSGSGGGGGCSASGNSPWLLALASVALLTLRRRRLTRRFNATAL